MKKRFIILLAAAMAVSMMFAGCGNKENETGSSASSAEAQEPEVYTAKEMLESTDYDVKDYVKLGKYKKISVEIDKDYEVTDENLKTSANEIISQVPYYVESEEAAKESDKVNIDYVGKMDGETFDGGSAEKQDLILGSNSFIEGFESGLVGHKAGETVTLDLTFPDPYQNNPDFAGKAVTFEVTINSVSTPTEMTYDTITDDYIAQGFGVGYGISTVDDFNERMKDSLENECKVEIQKAYLEKLVAESEITLPDGLLDERIQQTMDSMQESCDQYGMELEDYIENYYGKSLDEYKEGLSSDLTDSLREELVLEALVAELNVEVKSDEFSAFVSYFAAQYQMTEDQFMEECGGKDYLILNYAEYYVALEEAAEYAKVSYVDMPDENTDADASADGDTGADGGSAAE